MRARIPKPEPAPEVIERQERANEKSNRAYLNYAHRSLLIAAHNVLGYGGERLRRLSYNSYDVGEEYLADNRDKRVLTSVEDLLAGAEPEYAEENFFETVENTYTALRGDLLRVGFDPDVGLWVREPFTDEDFPKSWRKVTASQRERRGAYLFYANEMSQMCRTMLCMVAMELHQTGGVGAERLYRVMEPVRTDWIRFMRVYLTMDAEAVKREQKAMRDAFNGLGCFQEEYAV